MIIPKTLPKQRNTPRTDPPSAKATLALFACFGVIAPAIPAQETPVPPVVVQPATGASEGSELTIRAFSRITLVDVTVTDAKGHPVHGLPQSAFTVTEDGKLQPIRSFSEIGKDTPLVTRTQPPLPAHFYSNVQPTPTTSAVNVLLLDSLNTSSADQIFVRQETMKYLKTMLPGTRIAILGLSSQLRLLQGFTTDPNILLAAIDTKKNRALPSPFADVDNSDVSDTNNTAEDDASAALQEFSNQQAAYKADVRTQITLEALNQIAAYLSGIKGRKNLIWFTGGVPLQLYPQGGSNDIDNMTDYTKQVRKTTDLLTAAQIAVYPVDARGLQVSPTNSVVNPPKGFASGRGGEAMTQAVGAFSMKTASEHLSMDAVASATGGQAYFNTNGLSAAVRNAIDNGQNYYTLSYTPPSPPNDGAFHSIKVRLNQPGFQLSYRQGYYADDVNRNAIKPGVTLATVTPEPYGSNMIAAMGRGTPTSSQVLFTVRVEPRPGPVNAPDVKLQGALDPKLTGKPLRRYDVLYSIPGRQFTFNDTAGGVRKGSVELDIAAYDVYGKPITHLSQTIDLNLSPERYKALQTKPMQIVQAIDLPLGEVFLRIGVLDSVSDKTGTIEIPLTVPRKDPVGPSQAAEVHQPKS